VIVVDASALVEILLRTPRSRGVRHHIGNSDMVAPDLINVEVLSALKRVARNGDISTGRADQAIDDLQDAPIAHFPTLPLLRGTWRLRGKLSMYDACYVSLAEALDCRLVTSDMRLAQAPNLPVTILTP
jgi:predicted nucleic acid-binding protein